MSDERTPLDATAPAEVPTHPPARGRPELTAQDCRPLEAMAAGQTNADIGRRLARSEKTVRNPLTRVYAKLGAGNRAEAVALYLRGG